MRSVCCLSLLGVAVMLAGCAQETRYYIDGKKFEGRVLREENGRVYAEQKGSRLSLPAGWLSESPPAKPVENGGSRVHVFEDRVAIYHPESLRGELDSLDELVSYCNGAADAGHPVILVLCLSGEWPQARRQVVQKAWEQMTRKEHIAVTATCPDGGDGWLVQ